MAIKAKTKTTWDILSEVDSILKKFSSWEKIDWRSEKDRKKYIFMRMVPSKKYIHPKSNRKRINVVAA